MCALHSSGFPGGSDGEESACNVGDVGLIPGLGHPLGRKLSAEELMLLNCGVGEDS